MKNTVFLLENEKGKKNWIEVSDQSFWGNPSVGDWIFVGRKQWQVKAILNEQAAVGTATIEISLNAKTIALETYSAIPRPLDGRGQW